MGERRGERRGAADHLSAVSRFLANQTCLDFGGARTCAKVPSLPRRAIIQFTVSCVTACSPHRRSPLACASRRCPISPASGASPTAAALHRVQEVERSGVGEFEALSTAGPETSRAAMAEDWESWASIIRSCVLTSKTPLTPYEINRDTRMLEGKDIPFRKLNFNSLEEMLRRINGLRVFTQNGKTLVQAIASEETAHIQKMVRLQKASKKKPRTLPVFNRINMDRRPNTYRPQMNNTRNVPYGSQNRYVPQNRYNVPNNRQGSAEPQRRPSSQQNGYNAQKSPSPTPMSQQTARSAQQQRQQQRTPPPTPPPSSRVTPPPPLLPTPPSPRTPSSQLPTPPRTPTSQHPTAQKSVHFAPTPGIQQRLTPTPSIQQRLVPTPQQQTGLLGPAPASVPPQRPSSISQRLNVAAASPVGQAIPSLIDDPRLRLNSYCEARGLPYPVYVDMPTKSKSIYSSVTVDSKKYRSYPQEAKTKDEAEKLAATAALEELIGKNKKPTVVTSDRALIAKRILNIINDHPNGLFESSIVESYIAKHNESLPTDWLKLVEHTVTVDVGANNLAILSPPNCDVQGRHSPITLLEPENIKLRDLDDEFWMHVYIVYNTTDIWGVIIDENHSDKIDELAQEMKVHYSEEESKISSVTPGKYYAVFDSEWHRVRCIKLDEATETATVFFIDRGDEDVFPVSRLRALHPKFCRLPAQSLRLSLAGLEIFEDYEKAQTLLEELLVDKSVYVRSTKNNEKFREDRYAGVLSAELFLEIDKEEVNANELIRNEILNKIANPLEFLGPEKVAQEVYISSVSKNAIFVQLKSQGSRHLKTLIKNLERDLASSALRPVLRFDPSKMYIVNIHDDWLRVKIVKIEDESTAQVFCVDVGNTITVKRNNLVLLEDLSEMLTIYPHQAVKVRLHKISPLMFDEKMANRLRDLAPKTDVFYMKVVGNMEDIPMVEFYKRTENNYLASLNDTLALEPEISSRDNNNNSKRIRNDRSSIGARSEFPLKAPGVPSIGSYFDVHITMAAHPGNFTIQPFKTVNELESLMKELSRFCENYTGPPLTPSSLKVGNMYAAKYDDDGRWYRAYVSKIISKTVCAVYFCDYGDYRAVSLEQLRPLENQFYDLPYQAIKAKLYGITPKLKGDWTVKDSLRFNELIVAKNFVSIIKSCETEPNPTGEMILGLELIDTSTSEDVYITNVLVNENRADKTE